MASRCSSICMTGGAVPFRFETGAGSRAWQSCPYAWLQFDAATGLAFRAFSRWRLLVRAVQAALQLGEVGVEVIDGAMVGGLGGSDLPVQGVAGVVDLVNAG